MVRKRTKLGEGLLLCDRWRTVYVIARESLRGSSTLYRDLFGLERAPGATADLTHQIQSQRRPGGCLSRSFVVNLVGLPLIEGVGAQRTNGLNARRQPVVRIPVTKCPTIKKAQIRKGQSELHPASETASQTSELASALRNGRASDHLLETAL